MKSVTAKPLPPVELPELRVVGKPLRRVDALGKVVGKTQYAADFTMPGMLHARVFRSSEPSARIKHLDVSKARALPGVVCVLTAEDLSKSVLVTDMPGQTGQKRRSGSDAHVLASDIVRFVGDPIALVAAETLDIADKALKLIEVEYEKLPAVYDPEEAIKPEAPVIISGPTNIVAQYKMRKGNVRQGMESADIIVENTFRVPFVDHAYLEPEAGVAWMDEKGVINIRVCTQVVEHFRSIALALGVPHNKLHIIGTMLGGGFGGKEDITVEIFLGLLTQKTNRPVAMEFTREESLLAHAKRHPMVITHKTGVTKDGRITAAEIKILADSGAYVYLSPYVLLYATGVATGPYRVDNLTVDSFAVATNNIFTSAFRGFGAPQGIFAAELQMDIIAKELGMDPFEFRCKNYIKTGEYGVNQQIKTAAWLEETASRAIEALGEKTPDHDHVKIGWGMASYMQSYGRIMWFHDTSQAWVGLEMDGSLTIRSGIPDLGAGQISAVCQIASEVIGVPMDRITIYHTDSAVTPLAGTSTATRQLYMSGNAVHMAASAVRKTLLDRASKHLEEPVENLDMADSKVFVKTRPDEFIALPELAAKCASEGLPLANLAMFKAPFTTPIDPENGQGDIWPDFTFGCMAVEVAVDMETGEVQILKSVACHDVGRAINPAAVVGQIEGGAVQGYGYALMEDCMPREGRIQARSLSEYLIPTSVDVPTSKVIILESGTGVGPFGAKGIGEPALTPAAPAVANAVADAIGIHVHELPLTPERVLAAIHKAEKISQQ